MFYVGKGTKFKKEDCKEYKTIRNALLAAAKDEALTVWDENGEIVGSLTDKVPEGALDTNSDGCVNTYDEDGNKTGTISAEETTAITGNTGKDDGKTDGGAVGSGEPSTASTEEPQTDGTDEGGGNNHQTPENGQNEKGNEPHGAGNTGEDDGKTDGGAVGSGEPSTASTEEPQTDGTGEGEGNNYQTPENRQNEAGNKEHGAGNTGKNEDRAAGQQPSGVIFPDERMKVTVICDGTLNLRRTPAWDNQNICGRAAKGQSYYVKAIHTVDGKKMVQTIDDIYLSGESAHVKIEKV